MEALFAASVASLYAAGVVGVHRLNVWRMRRQAGGFACLRWLDWDCLLEGLAPDDAASDAPAERPFAPADRAFGGGPAPGFFSPESREPRRAVLRALVAGVTVEEQAFVEAGFSGGQVSWLTTLATARQKPDLALARLGDGPLGSTAEFYLREHLLLSHRVHPLNLELAVFASKRRIGGAMRRFGEKPPLFFLRALASSLLGFNQLAIDNLARAVYFSRRRAFYVRAVIETPFIEAARPALYRECLRAP